MLENMIAIKQRRYCYRKTLMRHSWLEIVQRNQRLNHTFWLFIMEEEYTTLKYDSWKKANNTRWEQGSEESVNLIQWKRSLTSTNPFP
ncbi:hypothetical protein RLOC_00013969 [Lonchura striata]|uniref:Uncharacterized protein n=1 Tax=Lonchura striata TaxID=40157 RepID=A0A218VC58_9PASE|nr:hypothetical protein RLOC_00013969 [Lonchura striata domestica]